MARSVEGTLRNPNSIAGKFETQVQKIGVGILDSLKAIGKYEKVVDSSLNSWDLLRARTSPMKMGMANKSDITKQIRTILSNPYLEASWQASFRAITKGSIVWAQLTQKSLTTLALKSLRLLSQGCGSGHSIVDFGTLMHQLDCSFGNNPRGEGLIVLDGIVKPISDHYVQEPIRLKFKQITSRLLNSDLLNRFLPLFLLSKQAHSLRSTLQNYFGAKNTHCYYGKEGLQTCCIHQLTTIWVPGLPVGQQDKWNSIGSVSKAKWLEPHSLTIVKSLHMVDCI